MKKLFVLTAGLLITAAMVSAQDAPAKKQETAKTKTAQSAKTCDNKNCCMMKDGKMTMMKDGKEMAMENDVTLANGTQVMKDGTMITRDGKKSMMKNDQCVDMAGTECKMMPMHHDMKKHEPVK